MQPLFISLSAFLVHCSNSVAVGYDNITNTVLPVIQAHGIPKVLSKLSVYMFAYVMLIPSIPVNMAISYDNLVQNKIASKPIAKFACYIVPIILCIPLQTGSILVVFQTWTSLLFVSVANFIIPALVYFQCLYFRRMYNQDRQLTPNQLNILERIHVQSSSIGRFLQKMRHSSEGAPELLIFDETIPAGSNGQPVLTLTPVISHERTEDDEWSMVPDPDLEDYLLDPQQVHFPSKDATLSSLLTSLPRPALGDIERRHTSWRDSYDISRAISMSDPMKRANGSTPLARRITFNAANAPVPEFDHPMPIIDEAQLTTTSNPSVKSPGLMPPGQLMPLLIVSPSNTSEKAPTSAPASAKYPDSLAVPTPYGDYFGPTNLSRAKTLPTHPSFTTPAFRSIPLVLGRYGIRGHHAAAIVLLLVSAVVLLNVVLVITAWVSID